MSVTETTKSLERYLLLFIPWVLASIFRNDPVVSYFIAWVGSFFIFFMSYSGKIKPLPKDRPIGEQLMRPVFLVQIIFIGYMACTSIFYFLDLLGVNNNNGPGIIFTVDNDKLALTAQCQRFYVLGHASFLTGLMSCMRYPVKHQYKIDQHTLANILLTLAVVLLPLSILTQSTAGLSQFANQFNSLSFIAGTLALAFAIPLKKPFNTAFSLVLYLSNFYTALTSGFKEPIIISVLVLGIFLYPQYKKVVILIFVPALLLLFAFLPTYNTVFRENAWSNDVDAKSAYKMALDATLNSKSDSNVDDDTTWGFLVYRLSEIDMFTIFLRSTPENIDYYDLDLVGQSLISVIPRVFWPSKPITETLVMERVYRAGVVYRGSSVSAKPAYIVDGYLSGGVIGVILALFIYGAAAQLISQRAEFLFGGYILGTALIFSGLFQIFWRGLSFEFLLNNVVWSYVTMILLHKILKARKILKKI